MRTLIDVVEPVRLEYPNRFDNGDDAEEENEKRISQRTLSDCHSNPRSRQPPATIELAARARAPRYGFHPRRRFRCCLESEDLVPLSGSAFPDPAPRAESPIFRIPPDRLTQ